MKLIIDIDKEAYKNTIQESMLPPDVKNVVEGIKNGIHIDNIEFIDKRILLNKLTTEFEYDNTYLPKHFKDLIEDAYYLTKEIDF